MQQIKAMIGQFLAEPWWFKLLISTTLLISILFSGSNQADYRSGAKLAAAIFFLAYGVQMRRSRVASLLFFAMAGLSIYLSWRQFALAHP